MKNPLNAKSANQPDDAAHPNIPTHLSVPYNGVSSPIQQTAGSAIDMKKRVGMDVLSRFTQRSNQSLMLSVNKVKELKNQYLHMQSMLMKII